MMLPLYPQDAIASLKCKATENRRLAENLEGNTVIYDVRVSLSGGLIK